METCGNKTEVTKNILKDSAKAARIYELILDNKNLDKIKSALVDTEELNNSDSFNYLEYIREIGDKKDETEGKINTFTNAFKYLLYLPICEIKNGFDTSNNLYKLSAFYYFFKFRDSKDIDEENAYIQKIDSVVEKILLSKDYYYNILKHIGQLKEDIHGNKKIEKNDAYFKILFYLNETNFRDVLIQFMETKKAFFPQYELPLPPISFKDKDLDKTMKTIYNIFIVLQKTESFKTNQRFEYFQAFKSQPELLDEINYVLCNTNNSPITSLDRIDNEIAEEAINYCLDNTKKQQTNENIISDLNRLLEEGEKNKKESEEKYKKLSQEFYELNSKHSNNLNFLRSKISELRNNLTKSNEKKNKQISEISSLKKDIEKKEDIIERISYREVGSRIIQFFSLSLSKQIREEYEKNNISVRNIKLITEYMKNNLGHYFKYMKKNNADLSHVLKEIKEEKKNYNYVVHGRKKTLKKYIELMNAREKNLGEKINFIFNNSEFIFDYVFGKEKAINEDDITQEFVLKNENLKKKEEESKKKEESKKNEEDSKKKEEE